MATGQEIDAAGKLLISEGYVIFKREVLEEIRELKKALLRLEGCRVIGRAITEAQIGDKVEIVVWDVL